MRRRSVVDQLRAILGGSWRYDSSLQRWIGRIGRGQPKIVQVMAYARYEDNGVVTEYRDIETREIVFSEPLAVQRPPAT